jgi:hypothetical protein
LQNLARRSVSELSQDRENVRRNLFSVKLHGENIHSDRLNRSAGNSLVP